MERIFEPQSVEYQASNSMPLSDAEDNGFRLFGRTIQMSQSSAQTLTPQEIFVQKGTQAVEPLQSAKPTAQLPPSTPPLPLPPPQQQAAALPCPRCASRDTKFCYYNNYNVNQPRHFCRACHRYWTAGGSLRNVPVGSGRRGRGKQSAAQSAGLPPAAAVATAAVTTGSDEPVRRRMKPHNQQNQLESVEQPVDDSENHQPTERPQEQPSQRRMRLTKQRRSLSDGDSELSEGCTHQSFPIHDAGPESAAAATAGAPRCDSKGESRKGNSASYRRGGSINYSAEYYSAVVTGSSSGPSLEHGSPSVGPTSCRILDIRVTPDLNLLAQDGTSSAYHPELDSGRGDACMEGCGATAVAPPLASTFLLPPSQISLVLSQASSNASAPAATFPIPPLSLPPSAVSPAVSSAALSTAALAALDSNALAQLSMHPSTAASALPWLAAAPLSPRALSTIASNAMPLNSIPRSAATANAAPPNFTPLSIAPVSNALIDGALIDSSVQAKSFSHLLAPFLALNPPKAAAALATVMSMLPKPAVAAKVLSIMDGQQDFRMSLGLGDNSRKRAHSSAFAFMDGSDDCSTAV